MIYKKTPNGYILITTLLIVSLAITIGTYIFNRGSIFLPFSNAIIHREQAKQLVEGALQKITAQLAEIPQKKESENNNEAPEDKKKSSDKLFILREEFLRILSLLNQLQIFKLTQESDGIEAEIKMCLASQQGKININSIYDFENKKFIQKQKGSADWKAILQELCKRIETKTNSKNLFAAFEKILQAREYPFDDVTELLANTSFAQAFSNNIFYMPRPKEPNTVSIQAALYLTDIFTISDDQENINPFLLSHSIAQLLELTDAHQQDPQKRNELIQNIAKNMKEKFNWNKDWKTFLQPLYQKELNAVNTLFIPLFTKDFAPNSFCVTIEATVQQVTQRAFAIIKRKERADIGQMVYDIVIEQFYWI